MSLTPIVGPKQSAGDIVPAILPVASGRRLSNQIGRAFRGTFGATTGLRTITRSIVAEMLAGGASAASVTRALETCVLHHPARLAGDSHSPGTGASHSAELVELMRECSAGAVRSSDAAAKPPSKSIDGPAVRTTRGGSMRRTKERIVLIVEPDDAPRSALRTLLEQSGYTVVATSGADDAVAILDSTRIGLVVTEMYLDSRTGLCLLPMIAGSASRRRAKVLAYTRHSRPRDREWAVTHGASGYVLKRNGAARVLEVVRRLAPLRLGNG